MFKKALLALTVAGSLVLTGCGGGGGGGDDTAPEVKRNDVAGPLDSVQGQLSSDVLAPLTQSLNGTPLAGVVNCVDQAVVNDVLDVADALALALQPGANPATALTGAAVDVQAELGDLVTDLQGLVLSLAGTAGCANIPIPLGDLTNPLAGTPLAALGEQLLPALAQASALLNGVGGALPTQLSLGQLAGIVGQLQQAFNGVAGQIPAAAANAPVIGASLDVVSEALGNLQLTVGVAATGNVTGTADALTVTVTDLLDGVLTRVVPLDLIENAAGRPGVLTNVVHTAIDQLASILGSGLATLPTGTLGGQLSQGSLNRLQPFNASVLTDLLTQIQTTLAGGVGSGTGGPTGTVLDGVLLTLTGLLTGPSGGGLLTGLLGGLLGGVNCPLAGTPLALLCGIV